MDNFELRTSALEGHAELGRFGRSDETGVTFRERPGLVLHQVAVWPETLDQIEQLIRAGKGTVLQIEPLKFWIIGGEAPVLNPNEGATLDLSHSRAHLQISGPKAATLLNRFLPLDFRENAFPTGQVASTAFHHVGITLWRSDAGFELFLPRGFALSLWDLLREAAGQFGYEIRGD